MNNQIQSDKIKVLLLSAPYLPVPPVKYGGTERVIYNIIKGLHETCDLKIIATGDSDVPCELYSTVDKHLFFAKNEDEMESHQKLVDEANFRAKDFILELSGWTDLYHSHYNIMTNMLREMMEEGTIPTKPILTTLHGAYTINQKEFFEKNSSLYYNSISENQREAYPKSINWVGTVYNSIDTDDFELNLNPKDYVCFLGRFDPEKYPHKAIELAKAWGVKIILGGKIDHLGQEYFEKKIRPHINGEDVVFLGELDVKQKAELVGNALINLHPTNFREPFGLTVCEAACTGTPTLAIRRGALPEIIYQGRTGICVEDFEEGVHKFDELVSMDRELVSIHTRLLFNIDTMAKKYYQIYKKLKSK
ncbi:MAG: glycosyltransferase [Patescibacteria group bacterium]